MKITEETIQKSRFFSTGESDIWYVTGVQETTVVRLQNTMTGELEDVIAGDNSRFEPVNVTIAKPTKSGKGGKSGKAGKGPRAGGGTSKYKGVCLGRPKKDGSPRWRAQVWKDGRLKSLGTFPTELEAAAAVAKAIGDTKEYLRLQGLAKQGRADMAEQAENNPDRPKSKRKEKAWMCTRCHLTFKTKPTSCPGCRSASFREVDDE